MESEKRISWNTTEPPPQDGREFILLGALFYRDEEVRCKIPILRFAHYDRESRTWLGSDDLAIREFVEAKLQCFAWSEIPEGKMVLTLEGPDTVSAL